MVRAGPALRAASGGLFRHRVQTVVVFAVVAAASAAATLGLTLYTSANEGFLNAFAVYRGPDLAVTVNAARVTGTQLGRTSSLTGVTQATGACPRDDSRPAGRGSAPWTRTAGWPGAALLGGGPVVEDRPA